LGRYDDALPAFKAALDIYRRKLPTGDPSILISQLSLAKTLLALGRHGDAESLWLEAAEQCEQSQRSREQHWPTVLQGLVELYDSWHAAEPEKGYDAKASEWQAKRAEWRATTQPTSSQKKP
jgi:hypothetical protein